MNTNVSLPVPVKLRDHRLMEGVLGSTALLRGASPAQLAALASRSWVLHAKRGTQVFQRGQPLKGVFALAYGMVKVGLRQPGRGERVLRLVHPRDTFGEPAALLGRPAMYEAHALADSRLVVIPSGAIFALIEADPRAARQLVVSLALRTVDFMSELESSTLRPAAPRLAGYLESLAAARQNTVVELPAAKTVIAARLGMKKETLSRLLRRFAAGGLIEVRGREIVLLDREGLARLEPPVC